MKNKYLKFLAVSLLCSELFLSTKTIAQVWAVLGPGLTYTSGVALVDAIAADSTTHDIYAGGGFNMAGSTPVSNIAKWDGASWSALGSGFTNGATVTAIAIYNGVLYAAGQFGYSGVTPVKNIAQWNGSSWQQVGTGVNSEVTALVAFNGKLYVGGVFDSAGGIPAKYIASWNGSTWSAVGIGFNHQVNALTVYNNHLYACGNFSNTGSTTVNGVAEWTGTRWDSLRDALGGIGVLGTPWAMTVYNGKLIVGGYFSTAGSVGVSNVASWNGTTWANVGGGVTSFATVYALASYNGSLYAGGDFSQAGGSLNTFGVASWNGISWDSLGGGTDGTVNALTTYNGLYMGGSYTQAGRVENRVYTDAIAFWTAPMGINEITKNKSISIYPTPNNGKFTVSLHGVSGKAQISLYNVLGEQVYQSSLNTTNTKIDLSNKAEGIYLYKVMTETGNLVSSGKFVIQ